MRNILASIDIGSDIIKLVVGEIGKNSKIHILASTSVASRGVKNGFIIEPQALIPKLEEAFQKCENILGLKISKVVTTVPSENCEFFLAEGSTTIRKEDSIIRQRDVIHAMQASTYNRIQENQELIFVKPTAYMIDEKEKVKSPIGMEATKLTVQTLVATVPRKNVLPIIKCLEKIGVQVIDFSLAVIGDYYEFQKEMMKETVGCIINIGYNTTTVAIFSKGLLTNIETLDVGSEAMEHDLSYIFKLTKKDAKDLKDTFSSAHKRGVSASIHKNYTTKTGSSIDISEYEATEVVSSRLEEILKMAKNEINHLTKKEIHYIMITGGVSEMANFNLLLEEVFGHKAKIGQTREMGVRSNIYSASVGLIKYYEEKLRLRNQEFSIFNESEIEELENVPKARNFGDNSVLGKLFGYFFDN